MTIATRASAGLYALVRARFADDPTANAALVAAPGSPRVVTPTEVLRRAEAEGPAFGARLRRAHDGVRIANRVTGRVTGSVVQVEEIPEDVSST